MSTLSQSMWSLAGLGLLCGPILEHVKLNGTSYKEFWFQGNFLGDS